MILPKQHKQLKLTKEYSIKFFSLKVKLQWLSSLIALHFSVSDYAHKQTNATITFLCNSFIYSKKKNKRNKHFHGKIRHLHLSLDGKEMPGTKVERKKVLISLKENSCLNYILYQIQWRIFIWIKYKITRLPDTPRVEVT